MFFSQFIKFQTFSGVYVLKVLIKMLMKNYHQISRQLVALLRLITEKAHLTLSCYYYCVKKSVGVVLCVQVKQVISLIPTPYP